MPEKTPRRIKQEQDILTYAGELLPYEIVTETGYARGAVISILKQNDHSTVNRKPKETRILTEEEKEKIKSLYLGTPERGPIGVRSTAAILWITTKIVRDYLESEGLLKPKGNKSKNQNTV